MISGICASSMKGADIQKPWNKNTITVLHKAGPTGDASNYKPICTLDITYKIMFRTFYNRIITKIDAAQSVDQAGFIKGFSRNDHLITCIILIEKLWRAPKAALGLCR